MKLSKVHLFLFVVLIILIARCSDLDNNNSDTKTQKEALYFNQVEEASFNQVEKTNSISNSTKDPAKLSKEEELDHFQNTMDINKIKQAYAKYTSEQVKLIQKRLNNEGYDSGEIDGLIGPITIKAIASYQYDHGFEVTGILSESEAETLGIVKQNTRSWQ